VRWVCVSMQLLILVLSVCVMVGGGGHSAAAAAAAAEVGMKDSVSVSLVCHLPPVRPHAKRNQARAHGMSTKFAHQMCPCVWGGGCYCWVSDLRQCQSQLDGPAALSVPACMHAQPTGEKAHTLCLRFVAHMCVRVRTRAGGRAGRRAGGHACVRVCCVWGGRGFDAAAVGV
jgi:hypothetical protein